MSTNIRLSLQSTASDTPDKVTLEQNKDRHHRDKAHDGDSENLAPLGQMLVLEEGNSDG
ncbi:MAG: hypothetical protein KAX26_14930 [Anaerolineae bacterium]|nr:hypothetical protein [Anaerolineae bacterium]